MTDTEIQPLQFKTLKNVLPRRFGINLKVKVIQAQVSDQEAKSGEKYKACDGLFADSTGVMEFRFTGDQAEEFATQVDKVVTLKNCGARLFKRFIKLNLNNKSEVLETSSGAGFEVSADNISSREFPRKPIVKSSPYRKKDEVEREQEHRKASTEQSKKEREDRRAEADQLRRTTIVDVKDLKPRRNGVNIRVKILDRKQEKFTNKQGVEIKQCKGQCGDATGVINYRVTKQNADQILANKANIYTFRNLRSTIFQNHLQVELDKFGKLEAQTLDITTIDATNDLSAKEYERLKKEERTEPRAEKREPKPRTTKRPETNTRRTETRNNNSSRERTRGGQTYGDSERNNSRRPNPRKNSEGEKRRKRRSRSPEEPRIGEEGFVQLNDLRPGFHGSNVYVRIISVEYEKNGKDIDVCKGVCGDDTGIIQFRVTRELAEFLRNSKDKTVAFLNCRSNVFQGFHDLGGDKYTTVKEANVNISNLNHGNDLSSIEYEKKIVVPPSNQGSRNTESRNRGPRNNRNTGERKERDDYGRDQDQGYGNRRYQNNGRSNDGQEGGRSNNNRSYNNRPYRTRDGQDDRSNNDRSYNNRPYRTRDGQDDRSNNNNRSYNNRSYNNRSNNRDQDYNRDGNRNTKPRSRYD